jgi:hypothetical protein
MPEGNVTGIRSPHSHTSLSAKGANGAGSALNVSEHKNISISFATDGGGDAALTVKFQGSIEETEPTWASAQSVTNMWDYIEVVDLENGSPIDGDTGVAVATADDYRLFEMNVNGLKWVNAIVSGRTQGEVTVKFKPFTNE